MTQTMHHRGPDGYGFHSEESDSPHMGHARLSIIGLETEASLYIMLIVL